MATISTIERLTTLYGPLMSAKDVRELLRMDSSNSLSAALKAATIGFEMFFLPGRRGRFARTADVASWLNKTLAAPQAGAAAPPPAPATNNG